MISIQNELPLITPHNFVHVIFNGIVIGYIDPIIAQEFSDKLREIKVLETSPHIHKFTSITYIPTSSFQKNIQFPGIFIYTEVGRALRQVLNLVHNKLEWIDP